MLGKHETIMEINLRNMMFNECISTILAIIN